MRLKNFRISFVLVAMALISCDGQIEPSIPLSLDSGYLIIRMKTLVPSGRIAKASNILVRYYNDTSSSVRTTYPLYSASKSLLQESSFDLNKPTVIYALGYVELEADESVQTVIRAYIENGSYNILLLDWSNMAYGKYLTCALDVDWIGKELGKMLEKLIRGGMSLKGLHLVGHSLGAHLVASASRHLSGQGLRAPRLTGLDPAYPGFYPPLLSPHVTSSDAEFVDVIHTDGGGYGGPQATGHADFWPNEGRAKQPGCLPSTLPLTIEDFCSHHRSWRFWSESLRGGEFLARNCGNYDEFLKGGCQDATLVHMGVQTKPGLRGNFYLRTGAKSPFALGEKGAQ